MQFKFPPGISVLATIVALDFFGDSAASEMVKIKSPSSSLIKADGRCYGTVNLAALLTCRDEIGGV